MVILKKIVAAQVVLITMLFITDFAQADDSRCAAPPYGGTDAGFHAFVKNFGHIVVPDTFLSGMCRMKFRDEPRTALYNLGFTDEQIDIQETSDLGVDALRALKNLADKTAN